MRARQATRSGARPTRAGTTGIIRHLDELGRIVIPIEIRKRFGLIEKDPLEISVHGETIVLSKLFETCVFCGADDGLVEFRGRSVCSSCLSDLATR